MVLRLAETGESGRLLFNVVGGEFEDLMTHVLRVRDLTGWPLDVTTPGFTLESEILRQKCIPNQWRRWCTRTLKIEPTQEYLKARPGSVLAVGLRADEEERQGLYGDFAEYRYPLREWGWTVRDVNDYLEKRGVCVPRRTNCPLCYAQRLGDWWMLWKHHPEHWAKGEKIEAAVGRTFRPPSQDSWPKPLADLRAEFEAGKTPGESSTCPCSGSRNRPTPAFAGSAPCKQEYATCKIPDCGIDTMPQ